MEAQTVRQIVRISMGGSRVRIRLSNLFGTTPVTIGPAHIAEQAEGSTIKAITDHPVTFGGQPTVTIPVGTDALSDPVALPVTALEELSVSMYIRASNGPSTIHGMAMQTAFITQSVDATAATVFPKAEFASSRFFLTDVEVATAANAGSIVLFGDSLTDGFASTPDRNARWTDVLTERVLANPSTASIAVVNSGISGNRILHDGAGPSALSRFDRDALDKPGVRWILLLEGINDIGASSVPANPEDSVSAQQIIDGMQALIARAHAKGIRIWGATLTPFAGVEWPFFTEAAEAKRQQVNTWIRTSRAFDAVIDFDQTTRDPNHPDRYLPAYDSGDHLHPNDAGYKAMAASIDLRLFDASAGAAQ
jgi:lysophospholipase L1-like esterase